MSTAGPQVKVVGLRWNPQRRAPRTEQPAPGPRPGRVAEVEPVLLSVEEAARCLGVGRTQVFVLLRQGALKSVRIGRRRLIPRSELDAYVQRELDRVRDEESEE